MNEEQMTGGAPEGQKSSGGGSKNLIIAVIVALVVILVAAWFLMGVPEEPVEGDLADEFLLEEGIDLEDADGSTAGEGPPLEEEWPEDEELLDGDEWSDDGELDLIDEALDGLE